MAFGTSYAKCVKVILLVLSDYCIIVQLFNWL